MRHVVYIGCRHSQVGRRYGHSETSLGCKVDLEQLAIGHVSQRGNDLPFASFVGDRSCDTDLAARRSYDFNRLPYVCAQLAEPVEHGDFGLNESRRSATEMVADSMLSKSATRIAVHFGFQIGGVKN